MTPAATALAILAAFMAGYNAARAAYDPNLDPDVVALPACVTDAECDMLHGYIQQLRHRHD